MSDNQKDSIQQKITNLHESVAWFDSEDFSLEEALDKFASAEKLAHDIEQDLKNLKNQVNVLKTKFNKD